MLPQKPLGALDAAPALDAALDADVREVKVKLPVDQVLRLHLARMKQHQNFSKIVSTALTRYFDDLATGR